MREAWGRAALGIFLEFRPIPVLLWSYTAVALGTALAAAESGSVDGTWFAVAMALAALVQGWETHAVNEIFDWRSGTDRDASPRALSGGSKVVPLGLLGMRGLWAVFAVSSATIAVLAVIVGFARAPWLVLLVAAGYALGLGYTLPPVATAYRPFAGEWLGGFPGVLLAGVGAYAIQSLRVSVGALLVLAAHACICVAMLVMHHYADVAADARAVPLKRTTVVALGLPRARTYATALAASGAALYGVAAFAVHPAFAIGAALSAGSAIVHGRVRPGDLMSVTRHELRVIQLGLAAGLVPAALVAPALWPLLPVAGAGYAAHLLAVAPPAGLARAWRRTRPGDAPRRD